MAYDFDGSTSKIDFGDVTFLDGLSTISFHCWVNPDVIEPSEFDTVVAKLGASGFRVLLDGGVIVNESLCLTYDDGANGQVLINSAGGSVTAAGGWIPVGFELQRTATGLKTRVAGAAGASPGDLSAHATFPNNAALLLMGVSNTADRWFDGQMCELAFWNRVLTGGEWTALAAADSPIIAAPSGLIFYARLLNNAVDEIGSITGTITGATPTTHPTINYSGGGGGGVLITQLERRARGLNRGVSRGVA